MEAVRIVLCPLALSQIVCSLIWHTFTFALSQTVLVEFPPLAWKLFSRCPVPHWHIPDRLFPLEYRPLALSQIWHRDHWHYLFPTGMEAVRTVQCPLDRLFPLEYRPTIGIISDLA